jgi:hypothetical protein
MKIVISVLSLFVLCTSAFGQTRSEQIRKIERDIERTLSYKNTTKVIIKGDVVQVHAEDLDDAKDTLFEQRSKHPQKKFQVHVAPLPRPSLRSLQSADTDEIRVSLGKSLVEGYKISYDIILEMMEKERPKEAAAMKADPFNLRGNLSHIEKFVGLDKINSKELSLTERCYRVCWVEGLARYEYGRGIQVIFK